MKRRSLRATGTLTALLAALTLLLYLLGMAAATLALANALCESLKAYAQTLQSAAIRTDEDVLADPDATFYNLCSALRIGNGGLYLSDVDESGTRFLRSTAVDIDTARVVYDAHGEVVVESGDILCFQYLTEAGWAAGADESYDWDGVACATLSREAMSPNFAGIWEAGSWAMNYRALRLTGCLDGRRLTVQRIEGVREEVFDDALTRVLTPEQYLDTDGTVVRSYTYVTSDVIRRAGAQWDTLYEDEAVTDASVTLYTTSFFGCAYDPGGSVTDQGVEFENLLALTHDAGAAMVDGYGVHRVRSLTQFVEIVPYYLYLDGEKQFVVVTAMRADPLAGAITLLRNWYIVIALVALVAFALVRGALKERLTAPVARVADAMTDSWRYLGPPDSLPRACADVRTLMREYEDARTRMATLRDQVERLERALHYAEQAEQRRRELTSHIAHELKTPLAIVGAYTEGLSEHIAEEKREQYLATIRGEVEQMDALVRQMLDLSRLEAGRVELRREMLDLRALAGDAAGRFSPAAAARGLRIDIEPGDAAQTSADRARTEQVVRNLLSNAVRYASEGSVIRVRAEAMRGQAALTVENDCPPLPPGALEKLFEPFYRVDESRTGAGTGLGLAICKSIADLHGGTIRAEKTPTGLRFIVRL